jgi:hypothetical protein
VPGLLGAFVAWARGEAAPITAARRARCSSGIERRVEAAAPIVG